MKAVTVLNTKSWSALKFFNKPKAPSEQPLDPNSISAVLDGEWSSENDATMPEAFASNPQVDLTEPLMDLPTLEAPRVVDDWCAALASASPLRARIGDMIAPASSQPMVAQMTVSQSASSPSEVGPMDSVQVAAPSGTILGFDALRAFAIVGVVAYHLMPKAVPGGYLGVDIFFVLSGFLITRGLANTWAKHQNVNLKDFFARRFNRIVPSLLVVLLTCATIGLLVGQDVLVGANKQIYGSPQLYQQLGHHFCRW